MFQKIFTIEAQQYGLEIPDRARWKLYRSALRQIIQDVANATKNDVLKVNYLVNDANLWQGVIQTLDNLTRPFAHVDGNSETHPFLATRLENYATKITKAITTLLQHISTDADVLADIFASQTQQDSFIPTFTLERINWTSSDVHEAGLPVLILDCKIHGEVTKIVYKPHTLLTAALINGDTTRLRANPNYQVKDNVHWYTHSLWEIVNMKELAFPLPTRTILPLEKATPTESYGYETYLPVDEELDINYEKIITDACLTATTTKQVRDVVESTYQQAKAKLAQQVRQFAQEKPNQPWPFQAVLPVKEADFKQALIKWSYQSGASLAMALILGIEDLHLDNCRISQLSPYLLDIEVCFSDKVMHVDATYATDNELGGLSSKSKQFIQFILNNQEDSLVIPSYNLMYYDPVTNDILE
ncbi:MAG: DUF4135 domain-containing protein, partial [Gammaproteobacteria bacterium]